MRPLQRFADCDHVENVYLFVADSVRSDAVSDDVTSLGLSGSAISASSFTASSFPSIVTGNYPTTHRVWHFDHKLPTRPALLDCPETFLMSAETIWEDLDPVDKPPFKMIGATANDHGVLSDASRTFVAIEHHQGGHTPYGDADDTYGSTIDFFQNRRPSFEELPPLYRENVREAESVFLERMAELDEAGILDDTLVIYTSDHGELLGEPENGMAIGHGMPMTPDVVTVPVVFAGAGLPDRTFDTNVSGCDIAPTALSALGRLEESHDGQDLWEGTPSDERYCRSEIWAQQTAPTIGEYDVYRATSVWDDSGGYVFHHNSRIIRTARILGSKLIGAPESYLYHDPTEIERWIGFFKSLFPAEVEYGAPQFSKSAARAETSRFEKTQAVHEESIDTEQLRKLGYLE